MACRATEDQQLSPDGDDPDPIAHCPEGVAMVADKPTP